MHGPINIRYVHILLTVKMSCGICIPRKLRLLNRSTVYSVPVAYPGILFRRGSTNSVEDRGQTERGSGGGSPLVRGSGGSYNLVQEISFHIAKFS